MSVEAEHPWGSVPDERGSLGTLSWARAAKVAGLAGAVAALAAASAATGYLVHAADPPAQGPSTSVVVSQQVPAP